MIIVKSDFKLNDNIATIFSKLIYENLLDSCSIQEAFASARAKLRLKFKEECESCCCGHSHTADCEWHAYLLLKGVAEVSICK